MKHLEIQQAENGFVLVEYKPGTAIMTRQWVATNLPAAFIVLAAYFDEQKSTTEKGGVK